MGRLFLFPQLRQFVQRLVIRFDAWDEVRLVLRMWTNTRLPPHNCLTTGSEARTRTGEFLSDTRFFPRPSLFDCFDERFQRRIIRVACHAILHYSELDLQPVFRAIRFNCRFQAKQDLELKFTLPSHFLKMMEHRSVWMSLSEARVSLFGHDGLLPKCLLRGESSQQPSDLTARVRVVAARPHIDL